jgi:N-hydroxyarylamine O-acetyltransferase
MEIQSYLDRLGLQLEGKPSLEQLTLLHEQHLLIIPFENLDIHRGVEIILDEKRILDKIISNRRGGFCYELNGAFAGLLRNLGYQVDMYSAEVSKKDGGFGIPFDHMALGVSVSESQRQPWLADVGFGDLFRFPFPLVAGQTIEQPGDEYRLQKEDFWWILERRPSGDRDFSPQYRFTLEPRKLEDFAPACRYHQSSPESHFTRRTICTKALPDGRITLHPDRVVITHQGTKFEEPVGDRVEWSRILEKEFGIAI